MSDGPKSAVELAMERFRKKDAEAGVTPISLTDDQRAAIAEIKNVYQAKLAHAELMHQSASRAAFGDASAQAAMDDEYRRERERFVADRDARIEKIRQGEMG